MRRERERERLTNQLILFYLDVNFDKSTIGLHYLCIFFMFAKFQGIQRSIVMSSINYLNSSFSSLKYYIKYEFMDQIVNDI